MIQQDSLDSRAVIKKLVDSSFKDMVQKSVDPYYYQKEHAYKPKPEESNNGWIIFGSITAFVVVLALILFRKRLRF